MTTPLYGIFTQLQDIHRLAREVDEPHAPLVARLSDLTAEVENELHRQDSDLELEVDSEQCC